MFDAAEDESYNRTRWEDRRDFSYVRAFCTQLVIAEPTRFRKLGGVLQTKNVAELVYNKMFPPARSPRSSDRPNERCRGAKWETSFQSQVPNPFTGFSSFIVISVVSGLRYSVSHPRETTVAISVHCISPSKVEPARFNI